MEYTQGQLVMCRNQVLYNAANYTTAKLAPRYTGPYIIKTKISFLIYELADKNGKQNARFLLTI